jgi:hypothetical protein
MAGQREVLRNGKLIVACWVAVIVALVGTPIQIATTPHRTVDTYVALGVIGFGSAAGFCRATRLRIEMSESGLDVYKFFRTVHVPWRDVVGASADYYGLHIRLASGRTVTAASMGRPNWASWLRLKEVAPDRWVRRIEARAAAARQAS